MGKLLAVAGFGSFGSGKYGPELDGTPNSTPIFSG